MCSINLDHSYTNKENLLSTIKHNYELTGLLGKKLYK